MGGQRRSLAVHPPERTPIPTVLEDVWGTGPVRKGAENLAPPGFDPQTFQPVASGYAEYGILAVLEMYAVLEEILLALLDP